jgi:hypothetical protein
MKTFNINGQHPLSHANVPRDMYIHRLEETSIQIVSELKLEANLKELHYPTILSMLLVKYPQLFYIENKTTIPLAAWELITIVFNILENNSHNFHIESSNLNVSRHFKPAKSTGYQVQGGYIKMNEKFKDIYLMNATRIVFNGLYPNILLHLLQNGEYQFNLSQFPKIYQLIKLSRIQVKKMAHESKLEHFDELNTFIKIWLNMTYGILNSPKSYLRDNSYVAKKISQHSNMMMKNIHNEFSGHIVYIDTDEIIFKHFHEISARFVHFLQNPKYSDIPWEEDKVDFMISRLKKYILKDSQGQLQIKGYKMKEVG